MKLASAERLQPRGRFGGSKILFTGLGRVRDVATGMDGNIYVLLNQPDRIARVSLLE